LKALKPCFPYSSLEVVGSTCVGFLPLSRVKDRKIINQHAKMEHCAAMIQGLVRGQKCRLLFWEMKKDKYLNTMAGKIQRVYRGSSARCRIKELQRRKQQDTLIVAIKRIQIFLRSAINKRHVKAIEASSAVQLQALFRGYLGRKLVSKIKYKNLKVIEHREACCVRIQAICRMYFSKLVMMRKRYCYEAEVLREQELYQQRACIKIQSAWRTAMVRHHTYKLRIELSERRMKQREEAVGLIARKLRLSLLRYVHYEKNYKS
jgi:IQ calmodulin-binding motif.